MSRIKINTLRAAAFLLSAFLVWPAAAQEDGPLSKLEFHGYLTQAFAISDGAQFAGITEDGTAEYRTGALQLGYRMTEKDKFVIQLSHEVLGDSPSNDLRDDLELDWLFYQRSFSDATSVKVGRAPLPIGIYNQVKDVGTVLPFFRPSSGVYGDGTWTSDTIDGVVFSHKFGVDSPWRLDADLYYGNWEGIESDTSTQTFGVADANNAVGVQLWLNTPATGLRFGLGFNHTDVSGGVFQPGIKDGQENMYFSIDGSFDRVTFRAEHYNKEFFAEGYWKAYYAEILVKANSRLTIMASYEKDELKFTVPFFATFEGDWADDVAVGLNYKFRSDLVVKLEHHWHEGFDVEGQPVDAFFGEPIEVNYSILSLSTHF